MRLALIALLLALGFAEPAAARVNVHIPINVNSPPELVRIPGLPVLYAPNVEGNYFRHGGLYWVYDADHWYSSRAYNGPWRQADPIDVPRALLNVPVRYYNSPPFHFQGLAGDALPPWHDLWGSNFALRREAWDPRRHFDPRAQAEREEEVGRLRDQRLGSGG